MENVKLTYYFKTKNVLGLRFMVVSSSFNSIKSYWFISKDDWIFLFNREVKQCKYTKLPFESIKIFRQKIGMWEQKRLLLFISYYVYSIWENGRLKTKYSLTKKQ